MVDDSSQIIQNAECYTINSPTSIYSYANRVRNTYTQIGGKWYKSAESSYLTIPSGAYCVPYNNIATLSSNAEFYPIYAMIAFELAIFTWFLCWWLFRRLFKWR